MQETGNCLMCGVALSMISWLNHDRFCCPEHSSTFSLLRLQEAATEHHSVNPVEFEQLD